MAEVTIWDVRVLRDWHPKRKETVRLLNNLADEFDRCHTEIMKTSRLASATSIVGGVLGIGATFFSGGLALPGVAAIATVGGAVTSLRGKYKEHIVETDTSKRLQKVIDIDNQHTRAVKELIGELKRTEERIFGFLDENADFDENEFASDEYSEVKEATGSRKLRRNDTYLMTSSAAFSGTGASRKYAIGAAGGGIKAIKSIGNVGRFAKLGMIFNAVLLPINIMEFVRNHRDLQSGATGKVSNSIRDLAAELLSHMEETTSSIIHAIGDLIHFSSLLRSFLHNDIIKQEWQPVCLRMVQQVDLCMIIVARSFHSSRMTLVKEKTVKTKTLFDPDAVRIIVLKLDTFPSSSLKELALWMWCYSVMDPLSITVVLNANFPEEPKIWSYFGKILGGLYRDETGIAMVVPNTFSGRLVELSQMVSSTHHDEVRRNLNNFRREQNRATNVYSTHHIGSNNDDCVGGRSRNDESMERFDGKWIAVEDDCLAVNVELKKQTVTLIAISEPRKHSDINTPSHFIKKYAVGCYIIVSASETAIVRTIPEQVRSAGTSIQCDGIHVFLCKSLADKLSQCGFNSLLKELNVCSARALTLKLY